MRVPARLRPPAVVSAAALVVAAGLGAGALVAPASAAPVPNPSVVAVGSGSYASAPPAALDSTDHDVSGWVDKPLFIDGSVAGKPVPTNQWWTDLVVSRYSGSLWADPLVLSNSASGTKVFYPTQWNADGTARVLSDEIEVGGVGQPAPLPGDVVMADFEAALPTGWTATGNAFTGVSTGTNAGQSTVSGFTGKGLANSFVGGDGATGTLTSPAFTVERRYLAFQVGGGSTGVGVRLLVDGQAVRTATGKSSEQLSWVTWDLSDLKGRSAKVEIFDSSTGGWGHVLADQFVRTDDVSGIDTRFSSTFQALDAKALSWGDWDVSWRMTSSSGQRMDVTAARGTPYVWFETKGVTPQVRLGKDATVTGLDGKAVTFPAKVAALQVTQNGRSFGLHLPADASVERAGDVLTVTSAKGYLVVSAIPATGASLADLQAHAFAVPRDTTMTYAYDPTAGEVRETWDVRTDVLEGTDHATIQGWLPHHYVQAKNTLAFTGYGYDAPHGRLKMTVGTGGWVLRYPFTGILPVAPAPTGDAAARVRKYVEDYAGKTGYGGDTYWGGKDVLQLAEYMTMAKQVGDTGAYTALKKTLTTALGDWFTYTPGETEHFFARYPTWKALVGFSDSYGSFQFTDNHFHYGYFTLAAALLAMDDPTWGQQYGPMATLVAKQYANGDRTSTDFPYLRTFDTWEGHSYAGGTSSPGGNNQESSSEAIQSWVGVFLLGSALGDDKMQATGAMGYVTERAAVQEYWLDTPGPSLTTGNAGTTNRPAAYQHGTTGILFDSGQAFATYFSGDPAWIYGIQWMPTGPWFGYFGWDRTAARELLAKMFDERPAVLAKDTGEDLATARQKYAYDVRDYVAGRDTAHAADVYSLMGDALGNVVLGYLAQADPAQYADVIAELDRRADPVARGVSMAGAVYYNGLANISLGQEVVSRHVAAPTSQVYKNGSTYTYVVYNPTGAQQTYAVLDGSTQIGSIAVPARTLVRSTGLGSTLTTIELSASPAVRTVAPGSSVTFSARGIDQNGATTATPGLTWSVSGGGTISSAGVFSATTSTEKVTVTATSGSVKATTTIRVAPAPVLTGIDVSPGFARTTVGGTATFSAAGVDQYGDPYPLSGVTWSAPGVGTVAAGKLTASAVGSAAVTASVGSVQGSAVVAVATEQQLAGGATATASGGTASLGVDGSATTRWESPFADEQWYQLDLGASYELTGAKITWEAAAAKTYDVQVSSSANGPWTTIRSVTKTDASADDLALTGSGRYLRLALHTRLTGYGFSFWELAVRGVPSASSVTPNVLRVSPGSVAVPAGGTRTLAAYAFDAQGRGGAVSPTWSVTGGGSVSASGTFSAPTTAGTSTVSATWNGLRGTSAVAVGAGGGSTDPTPTPTPTPTGSLVDLARGRTATASSVSGANAAALAVDGDGGTRWESQFADAQWIQVDLGSSRHLQRVQIDWETAAAKRFSVLVSNSATGPWTTLATVDKSSAAADDVAVDGTGRYLRIDAPTRLTGYGVSIWSLRALGESTDAPAPTELAKGRTATASSVTGGNTAARAVDGDAGTRWESASADGQWWQVDLGQSRTLTQVQIDWETAAAKQFSVQLADSPTGPWRTAATVTKTSSAPDAVAVSGTGRYLRIDAPTRLTQWGVSIWEVRVYGS
ncbi:discoidin domain-containing protein [Cellulomonas sp. HZM]|uniref:galactose-binding domain-containing protein n=1 Tax=Cellulomonas sp. HZM TaxID=1454010 RepID=UPI000550EA7F|nr:discoidin domain-containing protein [Cellulomonas sp. HZM]